ncbi:MAG TPA: ABC transporter permease [candidate division Zixibacteria bacterium]|nr:ABC transporter permease [candidate division Zixibacteria bacterium]
MLTFRIAARNVFRQKRRTLLTVLTMMGGFTLASISIAFSDGSYANIISTFTRTQMGHIQIHGKGYLDRPTLYNTIDDYETVGAAIDSVAGVIAWSPRVYSAGLGSVGEKTTAVRIVGIDPEREETATRFDKKIISGKSFMPGATHRTILGKGLAIVLKAGPGDTLVVVSQGADGSIANDAYEIIGTAETGDEVGDQNTMYLSLTDAQDLLVLYGRAHEMVVIVDNLDDVLDLADQIQALPALQKYDVSPWQKFAASFYTAMQADRQGTWIMLGIIVLIVSVGVLNTVLMTVLERRREYGVLRAIGVRPGQVVRLVLYEVAAMDVVAVLFGAVVSLGVNYWLSRTGIDMAQAFTYGGMEFKTMYSEVNLQSFTIPAITVTAAALLVSVIPALKAARTAPAKAMRTH